MATAADLLASISPGMVTVALRTPLGVAYADPFAPGPSPVADALKFLGVSVDVYPGPPRDEDVMAPQLGTNLQVAALVVGGLTLAAFLRWRRR